MRKDKHLWSKIHTIYQRIQYNSPAKLGDTLYKKWRLKHNSFHVLMLTCITHKRSLTSCMMLHENGASKQNHKMGDNTNSKLTSWCWQKQTRNWKATLFTHYTLIRKTHLLMECADINKGYLWSCIHTCNKPFSKLTSYSWAMKWSLQRKRENIGHIHIIQ